MTIPIHNIELGKIGIGAPLRGSKLIAPLSYSDGNVHFNSMSILLPILAVKSYDATTGLLQLSLQGTTLTKLQQIQDMLITAVTSHQRGWFPVEKTVDRDIIRVGFQPFVDNGCLHLYCPSNVVGPSNEIHTHSGGAWSRGIIPPTLLATGQSVRLAIKMIGLAFHQHPITKTWTRRFRLQHRVIAIIAA